MYATHKTPESVKLLGKWSALLGASQLQRLPRHSEERTNSGPLHFTKKWLLPQLDLLYGGLPYFAKCFLRVPSVNSMLQSALKDEYKELQEAAEEQLEAARHLGHVEMRDAIQEH